MGGKQHVTGLGGKFLVMILKTQARNAKINKTLL
jgi:hypothetical protein